MLLLVLGEAGQRQRGKLLRHLLDAQTPLRVVPFVGPVQHSEEAVGADPNVEVGAKLAVLDPLSEDSLPATLILLGRKPDHLAKPALYRLAFAKIDEKMRIMAVERLQMGRNCPPKFLGRAEIG